jgi:general secretion pathway protein K
MPMNCDTYIIVEERETFKTIVELGRVSSLEDIGKALRQQNLYNVKSDLFLARMMVKVNEVTRNATVVLQRDQNTRAGAVLYYRAL